MPLPTRLPPLDLVQAMFDYDPTTGDLIRRKTNTPLRNNDRIGVMKVKIGRKTTTVARVCWYLFYRKDPGSKIVKHKNGNPYDNRIENLCLKRR